MIIPADAVLMQMTGVEFDRFAGADQQAVCLDRLPKSAAPD